jgi:hypothetical protein
LFSRSHSDGRLGGRDRTLFRVSGAPASLPAGRLGPLHHQVLAYWLQRRGDRIAPRRRDIEPFDIARALPNLLLWELDGRGGYRCRLSGTCVDEQVGYPLKGALLEQIPCAQIEEAKRDFDLVRKDAVLSYAERTMAWAQRPFTAYHHLLMPLLGDGSEVERLLSVITFDTMSAGPA